MRKPILFSVLTALTAPAAPQDPLNTGPNQNPGASYGSHGPTAPQSGRTLVSRDVRNQVRVNKNGFNGNGADRTDGISVDADPTGSGRFLMVWAEQLGTSDATQDIYCSRSTNNARAWSNPIRIDLGEAANLHDSELPKVRFTANGTALAVWEENRDGFPLGSDKDDVYYNRSTNGGSTWMPAALPLNTGSAGSDVSSEINRVWLDVDGNNVNVTWEEKPEGGRDRIWYTRSEDSGATWTDPAQLTSGGSDVDEPKVRGVGDRVHIAYIDDATGDDDVYYLRSGNGGTTWAPPVLIETDVAGDVDALRLYVDGVSLVAVWLDDDPTLPGEQSVHAVVSTDGGLSWGTEVDLSPQVSGQAGADADWPNAAVRGNQMFVVFSDDAEDVAGGGSGGDGGNQCYVSRSLDGGQSWTLETPLESGVVANRPVIVALDCAVVVRYEHGGGSNRTAFAHTLDDGETWTPVGEVRNSGPDVDEGHSLDEGTFVVASRITGAVVVGHFDRPTGQNEVYCSVYDAPAGCPGLGPTGGTLGADYCEGAATLTATGSRAATDNDVTLAASDLPPNRLGLFLASRTAGSALLPGSRGRLCLGGPVLRLSTHPLGSGATGSLRQTIDLRDMPDRRGTVEPGDTWHFQAWYRDGIASSLTSAVAVTFR